MKRKVFYTMIFVCILIFGSISIVQAYRPGRGSGNKPGRDMGRGPRQTNIDECIGELELSSDQISVFRKLREEHRDNMDQLREGMHKYKTQMRQAMQKGTDVGEDILNQGAELWKGRERERLRYRQQISNLLTQEQKTNSICVKTSGQDPGIISHRAIQSHRKNKD